MRDPHLARLTPEPMQEPTVKLCPGTFSNLAPGLTHSEASGCLHRELVDLFHDPTIMVVMLLLQPP